jgi:hypothetical protein
MSISHLQEQNSSATDTNFLYSTLILNRQSNPQLALAPPPALAMDPYLLKDIVQLRLTRLGLPANLLSSLFLSSTAQSPLSGNVKLNVRSWQFGKLMDPSEITLDMDTTISNVDTLLEPVKQELGYIKCFIVDAQAPYQLSLIFEEEKGADTFIAAFLSAANCMIDYVLQTTVTNTSPTYDSLWPFPAHVRSGRLKAVLWDRAKKTEVPERILLDLHTSYSIHPSEDGNDFVLFVTGFAIEFEGPHARSAPTELGKNVHTFQRLLSGIKGLWYLGAQVNGYGLEMHFGDFVSADLFRAACVVVCKLRGFPPCVLLRSRIRC